MEPGNERDEHASSGDHTQAWTPESDGGGWGDPVGTGDPGPVRRRPRARSAPGAARSERLGAGGLNGEQGLKDEQGLEDEQGEGPDSSATTWSGTAGAAGWTDGGEAPDLGVGPEDPETAATWAGWHAGADRWGRTPDESYDETLAASGEIDRTDALPADDDEYDENYGDQNYDDTENYDDENYDEDGYDDEYELDPAYLPDEDYEAGGIPMGSPEVWGTAEEDGAGYPLGRIQAPQFPGDPDARPVSAARRRRTGVVAVAALGGLALIGGGVAAGFALVGSHSSPLVISNTTDATSGTNSGHTNRVATDHTSASSGTNTPGATTPTVPTNTEAPGTTGPTSATTLPPTTLPPTSPTTLNPTAGGTVALGTWTAQQLDLILQIKNDLTNLNRDLNVQPDFSLLTVDASDLQNDLQAAQRAPIPNEPAVAQEWQQLVRDMGASNHDLDTAIASHDPNIARDLQSPVAITDTDYNDLSHTLNGTFRHADNGPGQAGRTQDQD